MSHSDQAITMREVADVFLKHEKSYASPDFGGFQTTTLSDDLLQDIAASLHALCDPLPCPSGAALTCGQAVYNAVYMLDERPFAYLPHHQANQIQYFMRRFRNSGGWKLIFPWRKL
jgi:hypothetical protein